MSNYSFTFIIGYRFQADRIFNLLRVVDWIRQFKNVQLIIVEQDTHSKFFNLNINAEHIFVKSEIAFNKSLSFNVGLKYSQSDKVIFGDSDLIMNPTVFMKCLKELDENYEMISPYNNVVDLSPDESVLEYNDIYKIHRDGRGTHDNQKVPLCGGITMWRRNSIYKIGGWPEEFIGWGGEDDLQTIKVGNFLKWGEVKANCYHLYHHRGTPDMNLYQGNLKRLKEFSQLDKKGQWDYINRIRGGIGRKNKYSDIKIND